MSLSDNQLYHLSDELRICHAIQPWDETDPLPSGYDDWAERYGWKKFLATDEEKQKWLEKAEYVKLMRAFKDVEGYQESLSTQDLRKFAMEHPSILNKTVAFHKAKSAIRSIESTIGRMVEKESDTKNSNFIMEFRPMRF